jgi:hypothetical protein
MPNMGKDRGQEEIINHSYSKERCEKEKRRVEKKSDKMLRSFEHREPNSIDEYENKESNESIEEEAFSHLFKDVY